jgi:hypothetical protein
LRAGKSDSGLDTASNVVLKDRENGGFLALVARRRRSLPRPLAEMVYTREPHGDAVQSEDGVDVATGVGRRRNGIGHGGGCWHGLLQPARADRLDPFNLHKRAVLAAWQRQSTCMLPDINFPRGGGRAAQCDPQTQLELGAKDLPVRFVSAVPLP